MKFTQTFFLLTAICLISWVDSDEQIDEAVKDTGGILSTGITPYMQHIRTITRSILKEVRGIVNNVDNNVDAVREQVRRVALDLGQNALGDVIENMRLTRNRVRRLLNTVKTSEKSVQNLLDNDQVSLAVKVPLHAVSFGLAALKSQVATVNGIVNAGASETETEIE